MDNVHVELFHISYTVEIDRYYTIRMYILMFNYLLNAIITYTYNGEFIYKLDVICIIEGNYNGSGTMNYGLLCSKHHVADYIIYQQQPHS